MLAVSLLLSDGSQEFGKNLRMFCRHIMVFSIQAILVRVVLLHINLYLLKCRYF